MDPRTPPNRRCWAEIDSSALRHNVEAVRKHLGAKIGIMAVVKANGYGHGLVPVATALFGHVEMFAVADLQEALELRCLLPDASIFILGPALPAERPNVVESGFIPAVSSLEEAAAYHALAGPKPVSIHLDIDTGMGRMGVWQEEAVSTVLAIRELQGLTITGITSHLPSADEDDAFTGEQLDQFAKLIASLRSTNLPRLMSHVENSAGLIAFPHLAGDMVRAGLMLYGSAPRPEFQSRLRPVMTWKTRVTLVREVGPGRSISYGRTFITPQRMSIATLAVGYADGYQRHLSGRGAEVLIQGRRCQVLGRVTMDQIMVDVTHVAEAAAGDEVVLIGRQAGEEIPVAELARKAGTIPWEIFTGIGRRVERVCL